MTTLILESIIAFLAGMLAASLTSFAFVLGERPPRNESIVSTDSHCTSCGKNLRLIDNIPVFGWLINKGKSHCCGTPIPASYFIGELAIFLMGMSSGYDILNQPTPYAPSSFNSAYLVFAFILLIAVWWRRMVEDKQALTYDYYLPKKSKLDEQVEDFFHNSPEINYVRSNIRPKGKHD